MICHELRNATTWRKIGIIFNAVLLETSVIQCTADKYSFQFPIVWFTDRADCIDA